MGSQVPAAAWGGGTEGQGHQYSRRTQQIICDIAAVARSPPGSDMVWIANRCERIVIALEQVNPQKLSDGSAYATFGGQREIHDILRAASLAADWFRKADKIHLLSLLRCETMNHECLRQDPLTGAASVSIHHALFVFSFDAESL